MSQNETDIFQTIALDKNKYSKIIAEFWEN